MTKYVAYYRVSTARQGHSGLGLDAQRSSVKSFLQGSVAECEYVEIESGKKADRPELAKAIAHAKSLGATLLIAKLDRLARNVHFISGLLESGVEIQAVDIPSANRMMLQLMAVFAEEEGRAVSIRTKAALAAAKDRGQVLGGFKWDRERFVQHREAIGQSSAQRSYELISKHIPNHQELSFNEIARRLNDMNIPTITNKVWKRMTVKRSMDRIATIA